MKTWYHWNRGTQRFKTCECKSTPDWVPRGHWHESKQKALEWTIRMAELAVEDFKHVVKAAKKELQSLKEDE